jgi:thiamine biosynthesis lipoprotein
MPIIMAIPNPAVPSPIPADRAAVPLRRLAFRALGTDCEMSFVAPGPAIAGHFEAEARAWVERFEARYSRFRPTSIVSRINQAAGSWVDIDAEAEQMLDICQALHAMSDGILDATTGPLLRLWNYRQPPSVLPDAAQITAARQLVGWPMVRRAPGRVMLPHTGMSLDFGGWGKEWAVDAVAELALQAGVKNILIDFGHDIRGLGAPPDRPAWHVGLEDPAAPGTHSGSIALLAGRGIASSGDYIRNFTHAGRRYGHIIDPRTGRPVTHGCRQTTVVADSCFKAGILSTTAFILGPTAGPDFIQRFPGAEGLFVTDTHRTQTRGFWNYVVT